MLAKANLSACSTSSWFGLPTRLPSVKTTDGVPLQLNICSSPNCERAINGSQRKHCIDKRQIDITLWGNTGTGLEIASGLPRAWPQTYLNWLFRQSYVRKGCPTGPETVRWTDSISGQVLCFGHISANIRDEPRGTLSALIKRSRSYRCLAILSGRQWYFVCPVTGDRASVLWKPLGADRFCSRRAWPQQVAYLSQFGTWIDRAHAGKAKVRAKLLKVSDFDEQELPPRPRRMRARTYERLANRFESYQAQLDNG